MGLQQGAQGSVGTDGQTETRSWRSYFSTQRNRLAVWTIYSRDLCRLHPAGGARPRKGASTSPQKANTVVYIFLYKRKLKIWPALKQIITVVPVHHLFLDSFFVIFLFSCFCVCDNFSVLQFAFFFKLSFFLGCWNHFLVCRVWRYVEDNVMCFHVGTKVDHGGVWFSERDFNVIVIV